MPQLQAIMCHLSETEGIAAVQTFTPLFVKCLDKPRWIVIKCSTDIHGSQMMIAAQET